MLRLCIPVHNEAPTIGVLLWRIRKVFQEFSREYDVTVFDDGSTDGTAELLDPYRAVMPLTVLHAPRRVGYAAAVDALVRHVAADDEYARRDALVLLQGDFTDQPEQLPELVKRFEGGADVVAVARPVDDAAMPADERRLRRWGRWAVRPFVAIPGFDDPFGGYRLVRIAVLRDLLRAGGAAPVCRGDDPWAANADFALTLAPFARRIENVALPGRWDVRPRPSHHRAWPDTLALFRWARAARRVARPQPRPAGEKGAPRERGEVPRPAGIAYAPRTVPPPPRPPRPTREELLASEIPSRRPRRLGPPIELEPAAARGDTARDGGRGARGAKPSTEPPPATRPKPERAAPDRAKAERAPREAAPPHDGEPRRHLRKVAQHPHHDEAPPPPGEPGPAPAAPLAGAIEARAPLPGAGDAAVVAPGAAAFAVPAGEEGAPPTRKKRRRRRRKKGGTAALAGEAGDEEGDDGVDEAGDEDTTAGDAAEPGAPRAGGMRHGDVLTVDSPDGDRPRPEQPRPAHRVRPRATVAIHHELPAPVGAEGDEDDTAGADDADDGGDDPAEGTEAAAGAAKRKRRRRRRRRPRPPEAVDGVSEATGRGEGAPTPVVPTPPAVDGD